jgi:hypothetical protein
VQPGQSLIMGLGRGVADPAALSAEGLALPAFAPLSAMMLEIL